MRTDPFSDSLQFLIGNTPDHQSIGPAKYLLVAVYWAALIGGTVIVERLFSYEGLGNLAIDAVVNRDLPLIQGIVLLFALLFTGVNLAVDLLCAALNPRLRHG